MTLTPEQSRAARGLLDWSQTQLGLRSNLSESTVRDFEKGRRVPSVNNLVAIRAALEAAGVEFTNGARPGVRMKATKVPMQEQAFVDGLKKFGPILGTNVQFDGLKLERAGDARSCKLTWLGSLVGTVLYDGRVAHFDPGVAHETAGDTNGISVEMLFADWAGAARRRAQSGLRVTSSPKLAKDRS